MEPNYRNPKRYNTSKYPIRQPLILAWLIALLSRIVLIGKDYTVEKINMEGIKPPYMLLSNHMYFIDFEIAAMGTFPHRVNNVVSVDGYYRRPWLMELIGCICKRKFVNDLHLVRAINKVLKRGDILCMYPEARYTPIGTTAYLPPSLGKLIKMNNVPVVVNIHHGNHLHTPFWNFRKPRKVPMYMTMTCILRPEEIAKLTAEEINLRLQEAFRYDEYAYQKERGIRITEEYRAEGLHKVLYQCPSCGKEFCMNSVGAELFCEACGKRWLLTEEGSLRALSGETEFSHVPDWFAWERENVIREVLEGTYRFEDEVDVYSMPRCWKFEHLGGAHITHDPEAGFVLSGHYRGKDWRIQRLPGGMNSLHVEYDYCYLRPEDCFDISTENDSFYCYPTKKNVITKLGFAVEAAHQLHQAKIAEQKAARRRLAQENG